MAAPAHPCYAATMHAGPPDPAATLPQPVQDRLRAYADLLATWTRRINLVSRNDIPHIWPRHVLDSLRLIPFIPACTDRAIDLGSGAGLPGLVLAIATGIPFDLVESDRRKCAFLQEAARITQAPVTIHTARIEACALAPARLVTARALAPLPALLALAFPFLAPGGAMLLPKGAGADQEMQDAARLHRFHATKAGAPGHPILVLSRTEPCHV